MTGIVSKLVLVCRVRQYSVISCEMLFLVKTRPDPEFIPSSSEAR